MRSYALFVPGSGIDATESHRVELQDLLQGRVGPLNLEILLVISSGVVHSDLLSTSTSTRARDTKHLASVFKRTASLMGDCGVSGGGRVVLVICGLFCDRRDYPLPYSSIYHEQADVCCNTIP